MSSEEIIQSWMNKIKLADDSRKAIIQKLNSVGQEIPTDEQLIEQGLNPVRFHEIENYLQPYADNFTAYYPTGPLEYDNISAYLSSLDVIRDELIQQLQNFSLWDGYPKDICKISEISAHIIYDSYLITFDSCGGDPVQPIHVRKGSPLGTLPQATYDEHVFLGWFTAAEGGTQVNSSTIPTSDTTYYAQYMNSYITLQKNGICASQQ